MTVKISKKKINKIKFGTKTFSKIDFDSDLGKIVATLPEKQKVNVKYNILNHTRSKT